MNDTTETSSLKEFSLQFIHHKGALLGFIIIAFFMLVALCANLLAPYASDTIFQNAFRLPPFSEYTHNYFILGTDDVGRDLLSRLIYGSRISLGIGFFTVVLSLSIGGILGLAAGYFGGSIDSLIMRINDIIMALPSVLFAIVIISVLGPSLANTIIAVSVAELPHFMRLMRAQVMAEKNKNYVIISRTMGASHLRQMFTTILPNCLAPIIVQSALGFSDAILCAAALGFLGLGAEPPIPEWGTMLSDARPFIESSPILVTLPGLCIFITVLAFNIFGDGLRDTFDPKLKR